MNMLLFCQDNRNNDHFSAQIPFDIRTEDRLALCRTFDDLTEMLRSRTARPRVAVLCVWDLSTMRALVQTRGLLADVSLVLVLPDRDREILNLAHLLRPRYIDYFDDNGERLSSVLERMIADESVR